MVAIRTDLLELPLENLRFALDDDYSDAPSEWIIHLGNTLRDMERALKQYEAVAESPSGVLDSLETPSRSNLATLDHYVERLRMEHRRLVIRTRELRAEAEQLSRRCPDEGEGNVPVVDLEALCELGLELMQQVYNHREAECKLLMDTVNTDVGVGD